MTSPKLEDFTQIAEVRGSPLLGRGSEPVDSTVPSCSDAAAFATPTRFGTKERPAGFATVRPVSDALPLKENASIESHGKIEHDCGCPPARC
jgi:hypothetical protein